MTPAEQAVLDASIALMEHLGGLDIYRAQQVEEHRAMEVDWGKGYELESAS